MVVLVGALSKIGSILFPVKKAIEIAGYVATAASVVREISDLVGSKKTANVARKINQKAAKVDRTLTKIVTLAEKYQNRPPKKGVIVHLSDYAEKLKGGM